MARAPKTFNFFINQPLVRKLSEKHIGMVDLPLLSVPSLQQQMVGHRSANMTLEQLENLTTEHKARDCAGGTGPVYQLLRSPGGG